MKVRENGGGEGTHAYVLHDVRVKGRNQERGRKGKEPMKVERQVR